MRRPLVLVLPLIRETVIAMFAGDCYFPGMVSRVSLIPSCFMFAPSPCNRHWYLTLWAQEDTVGYPATCPSSHMVRGDGWWGESWPGVRTYFTYSNLGSRFCFFFLMWTTFFFIFIKCVVILLLLFMFWCFGHKACRILAPWSGIVPAPVHWKAKP